MHNKCNELELSWNHPPPHPVCGKIVFHKTDPWCQKGWGPQIWWVSKRCPFRHSTPTRIQDSVSGAKGVFRPSWILSHCTISPFPHTSPRPMTAQEVFANRCFLISHGHRTQWHLLQLMLQTRGLGFFPRLLLLSCPLRFCQGSKSPVLMFLATNPPPPPHTQTHTPQLSGHPRNSEWWEKLIGVLSFFFFSTAVPLSAKKNDKIIFFLALSFKFWASFPQGKRNSPLCFGVLNREVSRPRVKAPWFRSLVGN